MNQLLQNRKDLQQQLNEVDQVIKIEFKKAPFAEKLKMFRELGSSFMSDEGYFNNNDVEGARVSLYDDFHWDRYESKTLEDIYESTSDHYSYHYRDDGLGLDDYLETSPDAKPRVFRSLLNNCIGIATNDW